MAGATVPQARSLRALVLDGQTPARSELTRLLGQDPRVGEVRTVATVGEALTILSTRTMDVVFCDVKSPGLAGRDLTRTLARFARRSQVVVATAHEADSVLTFELRATDCAGHPEAAQCLAAAVCRALQGATEDADPILGPVPRGRPRPGLVNTDAARSPNLVGRGAASGLASGAATALPRTGPEGPGRRGSQDPNRIDPNRIDPTADRSPLDTPIRRPASRPGQIRGRATTLDPSRGDLSRSTTTPRGGFSRGAPPPGGPIGRSGLSEVPVDRYPPGAFPGEGPGAIPPPDQLGDETIAVELGGITRFVQRSEVRFVEAHGDYARLHTATGSHLVRIPLTALEKRWADAGFVRIHRSTLVALPHVDEIRTDGGRCAVRLGDRVLQVSRRHTKALRDRLVRATSLSRERRGS